MKVSEAQTPQARYQLLTRHIAFMCAGILAILMLLNALLPSAKFSDQENRPLAQKPTFNISSLLDGSYFDDFTTFYADQFTGRNLAVHINCLRNLCEGKPESQGVYLGKDGHLFNKNTKGSAQNQQHTLRAMKDFLHRYPKLQAYFLCIPNASSIQSQYLPAHAPFTNQITEINAFAQLLPKDTVILDGTTPLQKHKDGYIFYKTDHHWTSTGAKIVFDENAQALGITSPLNYKKLQVSHTFCGTLTSKSGYPFASDTLDVFIPTDSSIKTIVTYPQESKKSPSLFVSQKLKQKDQYEVFFGGNHSVVDIKTTSKSNKTLLVFKDSYANSFMQFLYPYYRHIIMIDPRYYTDSLESLMRTSHVTDVLFLYSGDILMNDTNLADTLDSK